ncbi:MAG: VanZ family protein [Chloroflexia bacterium]
MLKLNGIQTARSQALNLLLTWGLALLWMAVIFYFSSLNTWTTADGPPAFKVLRKSAHVIEYGVLAILIGHALWTTWLAQCRQPSRSLLRRVWWVGIVLSTLYAISDELHQAFVPRREFHLTDILIDGLSATAALGIWYIVRTRKRTSNS